MAKRLRDNLSSAYVASANKLRPKRARQRIVAYVESYDDVFFWRSILQEFETDKIYFEVMLPSRTSLGKGKKTAMMNQLGPGLGEYMIACVDADYDWLMQGATPTSKMLCESPYIIHTYVYAIENYQCYAPNLHTVCVMSTLNDRPLADFEDFIRQYSIIIWPLLVWNVWCYRYGFHTRFSITDFCETVSFRSINPFNYVQDLEAVRHRVNRKMAWLQRNFPQGKNTYKPLREELLQMGLTPESCYLYMQGHTLFEYVVIPLLQPVCTVLRREREREIKKLAEHNLQMQNELSCYQHSQAPLDEMLRKTTSYKRCPAYERVRADITRLIGEAGLQK